MGQNGFVYVQVLANDEAGSSPINSQSLRVVGAPSNGTATITGFQIRYEPDPDFVGTDRLRYEICDEAERCDQAWLDLTVVP